MSTKNLTEFSQRIKAVREATGLNRADFAKNLSVSGAYIGQLESGSKTNPSPHFLNSVEKQYRINLVWLESGVGEMRQTEQPKPKHAINYTEMTYDDRPRTAEKHHEYNKSYIPETIKIMDNLDGQARKEVLKYAQYLLYKKELKSG